MEPSLSEIGNLNIDAGTSGIAPQPVIDNSKTIDTLNSAARFHAENTWRKYTQFLQNKADLFKNISDIEGLETAQQDRDLLKGQAADIFADILKDPSIAMGGAGYDALQGKIAKFKSDAMTSKQDKLDDEANGRFMAANPELFTDENTAKRQDFWKSPLGARKPVFLDMPTIFDSKTAFDKIRAESTQSYADVVGPNGEPGGAGYIETGSEVNPNAISSLWNMALQGQQDKYGHPIAKAIQDNFNHLPPPEQKRFKDMGGDPVKNYFAEQGQNYLDSYFPAGSYEKTKEGNYRFGKKLTADPNYLGQENLALKKKEFNEKAYNDSVLRAQGWERLNIDRAKLTKENVEDQDAALTVINQAAGAINNGQKTSIYFKQGGGKQEVIRISDPNLLLKYANVDKNGKVVDQPDAIDFDPKTSQVYLQFFDASDLAIDPKTHLPVKGFGGHHIVRTIPMDQRTWLKTITNESFKGNQTGGINRLVETALLKNGSLFNIAENLKNPPAQQQAPAQTSAQAPTGKTQTRKGKDGKVYTSTDGITWKAKDGTIVKLKK